VFKRVLRKPGLYKLKCTLHEEMRMTIRVRR
jgi:plastocyanin